MLAFDTMFKRTSMNLKDLEKHVTNTHTYLFRYHDVYLGKDHLNKVPVQSLLLRFRAGLEPGCEELGLVVWTGRYCPVLVSFASGGTSG